MAGFSQRLGRVMRTIPHVRPRQALAQLDHMVRGLNPPRPWRDPIPDLTAGTPRVPFLPAPRHARLEAGRTLWLLNQSIDVSGGIDWSHAGDGPLFAYHLHQHDYLRPGGLVADAVARTRTEPRVRAETMLDWARVHDRGVGWDPHPISVRAFTWARFLTSPGALEVDADEAAELRLSLAQQIDALDRNVETRLQANHLLSNLLAVVLGGLVFDGEAARRWRGRASALTDELARQVRADGAHEERSPMYHALLLENVLDLLNIVRGVSAGLRGSLLDALEDAAGRMLGALAVWTHRDGEIALFADSAFGIAQPPAELQRYGAALGVDRRGPGRAGVLDDGGYVRLDAGAWTLMASVAGPSPPHQPGHAHCDALAVELALGTERVVTDTGVYEYVPGERRTLARATRSHATLEVESAEQAEIWAPHRIGGRPKVALLSVEPGVRFEARCAGWSTPRWVHVRRAEASAQQITIHDRVKGSPGAAMVRATWPIAPGVAVDLDAEAAEAVLSLASGTRVRVGLPGALAWRVEQAPYFPEFGLEFTRSALVGEGVAEGRLTTLFRVA